jgi:tetratricopeptide (TPR) repeat protein
VSQLFDLLRRDANSQASATAPRLAHGDAVFATLGYAHLKRRSASPAAIPVAALVIGLLVVCWTGWKIYERSEPARSWRAGNSPPAATRQSSNAARRSVSTPSAPVPGQRALPQNLDALVNLAITQRTGRQFDLAKETLLKALTIAPRNAAAHYNLGQLYDQTNEPARAVEHYRTFLDTAGAEHVSRAAAVRARIAALSRTPE